MATDEAKSVRRVGLAQGCHNLLLHQRATFAQKEAQWATSAQKEVQQATSAQKEAQWATSAQKVVQRAALARKRAYNLPPPTSHPDGDEVEVSARGRPAGE